MKKLCLILLVAVFMSACKKHESDDLSPYYKWNGCIPSSPELISRDHVSGNTFMYKYMISMNGSQVDPTNVGEDEFLLPRVNKENQVTFDSSPDEAEMEITKVDKKNGYVFYYIKCSLGNEIKYNIAVPHANKVVWFLRYGLVIDDEVTNYITFFAI